MDITLYNDDCLKILPTISDVSIDTVITDLPYGITACKWDSIIPFEPMWEQLKRIIKKNGAIVLFGSQPFTSALIMSNPKMFKYEIIWEKDKITNFFTLKKQFGKIHENILIFCKTSSKYNPIMLKANPNKIDKRKRFNNTNKRDGVMPKMSLKRFADNGMRYPDSIIYFDRDKGGMHPTQKPVALMEYLIKTYTNEGETVLDFTMGSGTTGVAAKHLGRRFIGIEIDKGYFDIAKRRIDEAIYQPNLFQENKI